MSRILSRLAFTLLLSLYTGAGDVNTPARLVVTTNWFAELRAKADGNRR